MPTLTGRSSPVFHPSPEPWKGGGLTLDALFVTTACLHALVRPDYPSGAGSQGPWQPTVETAPDQRFQNVPALGGGGGGVCVLLSRPATFKGCWKRMQS